MTIERRLVSAERRDALRDKKIELTILLYDGANDLWRAYGTFPGGTGDHSMSSPVGHGKTAEEAADDLIRQKVCVASGLMTATWALGDAVLDLVETLRGSD